MSIFSDFSDDFFGFSFPVNSTDSEQIELRKLY